MTNKTQTKFEAAISAADKHEDPSARLEEFGVDVSNALDNAMQACARLLPAMMMNMSSPGELILDLAALFMSGVNVGVELATLEANADQ